MQAVADEPANGDVDVSLAHQAPIVDDPDQEAGEHEPDGDLRIDAWASVALTVETRGLRPKPGQVEHAIHPGEEGALREPLCCRPPAPLAGTRAEDAARPRAAAGGADGAVWPSRHVWHRSRPCGAPQSSLWRGELV